MNRRITILAAVIGTALTVGSATAGQPTLAVTSVHEVSDLQLAKVRAKFPKAPLCWDVGACANPVSYSHTCETTTVPTIQNGDPFTNTYCDSPGAFCVEVDTPTEDNWECSGYLIIAPGCYSSAASPCFHRQLDLCVEHGAGIEIDPKTCSCDSVEEDNRGTHDTCHN